MVLLGAEGDERFNASVQERRGRCCRGAEQIRPATRRPGPADEFHEPDRRALKPATHALGAIRDATMRSALCAISN
jgi:hypothetical protein